MNVFFQRILKNSGYLFTTTSLSAALSMLQGILVARLLGVETFGVLGTIIAFTSLINNLISFRMSELVVKYVGHYSETGDPQRAAATFKLAALLELMASLIAFGLVCLLAPYAALYLAKRPMSADLFVLYGLVILANLIAESSTGMLQIFNRFQSMGGLTLAASVCTTALVLLIYVQKGNIFDIVLAYLAGKVVGALGLSLAALAEASRRWGRDWWRTSLGLLRQQRKELAHFAISTNISASVSLITKDSELLWVSLFRTPVEVGYYKLALTLSNIVQLPVNPMPQTTYPELSRLAANQRWDHFRYLLRQGSRLAGSYTLVATLFLLLFGRQLIALLYSPQYLPAYPALIILLVGILAANTFYWRRIALLALGRADFPAKLNLVLAALKVIGILLLVPKYGYLASAALLAAFYWLSSGISLFKIRSLLSRLEPAV